MILEKVKTITEQILEENSYKSKIFMKTFPSFSITSQEFLAAAVSYANEFVKTTFKNQAYAQSKFGMSFDYDDLMYVEQSRFAERNLTFQQASVASFIDTHFETWYREQKNLHFQILLREGLRNSLEERIQYSLTALMLNRAVYENNKSKEIPKVELSKNSENMAATLFLMKEMFPKLYEEWNFTLIEPFKGEVIKLLPLIDKPNFNMKKSIYLSDSTLIERFFPFEMSDIKNSIFTKT